MKIKICDLTIKQINKICLEAKQCNNCPLNSSYGCIVDKSPWHWGSPDCCDLIEIPDKYSEED